MPPDDKDIPITRAVGRFLGHLWSAASKPAPSDDEPTVQEVSRETEERQGQIEGHKVTLRRTTIEEIEFNDDPPSS